MEIIVLIALVIIEFIIIIILFNSGKKAKVASKEQIVQKMSSLKHSINQLKTENESSENLSSQLKEKILILEEKIQLLEKANINLMKKKEELIAQKQKLEDLQKQKDELFAIAVHDIKNPAAAIKGYIELLESYDLTVQEQQEIIHNMLESSEQIFRLTKEITEIVAREETAAIIKKQMASIKEIIDNVCSQNQVYASSKEIKIINKSSMNIPKIRFDANKIEEVLDNLINNAVKYGPKGTSVQVLTFFTSEKLTVEISDDGAGLNEIDQQRAFDKGVRLTPKPTGNESSSGLGLWIVKKIIEEHSGKVYVKSKLGRGSTFGIELPIEKETGA